MTNSLETMSLEKWVKTRDVRAALKQFGYVEFVVQAHPDSEEGSAGRLQDLGFISGARGRYLSHAPFGEPIYTEISETIVALRASEAALLQVSGVAVKT